MLTHRPDSTRGTGDFGWLQARYSFSFSSWQDPRYMGHSALRVINQDIVAGHGGFAPHGHDNMEILTYVLRGTLSHQDTMGHVRDIAAGEFQLMSAGSGLRHSEMNRRDEPVELLQIWLHPDVRDARPRYAQRAFPPSPGLRCIAAPDEEAGDALPLRQDARIHRGQLDAGDRLVLPLARQRNAWLQVIRGHLQADDIRLAPGDGLAVSDHELLALQADEACEFLFFDLP